MTNTPAVTSLSLNSGIAHQARMSNSNPSSTLSQRSLDFWEFVCCGKCHLPFVGDGAHEGGPPIPFWLTECGHILCNQHLSTCYFFLESLAICFLWWTDPNQTCPCCGSAGIEVIPLHRDVRNRLHTHQLCLIHSFIYVATASNVWLVPITPGEDGWHGSGY